MVAVGGNTTIALAVRTAFGRLPDGIDDDRFVEASVSLAADTIESPTKDVLSAAKRR